MNDEILIEQLPYILQLGLNIAIARRHIAEPPLTQQDLAKALGRSQHYISRIERGLSYPTIEELERMSQLFSIELTELKPRFRRPGIY